ncbi:MAG: OsmC family protein [Gammaproteobacteria bacterium]|nr:OsmC family protein [Gammaproteobacteria bacterium]
MMIIDVKQKQQHLRNKYCEDPAAAMVTDHAKSRSLDDSDPYHALVLPMPGTGIEIPVGVHEALSGLHDAATPGDILCAALAACFDSSMRMVANVMGIRLKLLEVDVEGDVDVRGALLMNARIPVGFQTMRCTVNVIAAEGTSPASVKKLCKLAEHCCVVQRTLLESPNLETSYQLKVAGNGECVA